MKIAAVVAVLLATFAGPSSAIPIVGTDDPINDRGQFEFSVESAFDLKVSLANTSHFDARITGFGFDINDGLAIGLWSVFGTLDNDAWSFSFDAIPGADDRDAFAVTGANLWGGDTHDGIAVGSTGVFDFVGIFKDDLSISNVIVRFQRTGPDGAGSDRGYACLDGCDAIAVSEPSTLALIGLGLAIVGLAAAWRRRKSKS